MIVSIIVAASENNVIGKDNDLVWNLPDDTRYFMDTTKGHHIVTGRKNYESIPEKNRPLKDRVNLIVTRQADYQASGAVVLHSIPEALAYARQAGENECFVIGGGQIYKQALEENLVDRIYLTRVHGNFTGDTYFPEISKIRWREVARENHPVDQKHAYSFDFIQYEKSN